MNHEPQIFEEITKGTDEGRAVEVIYMGFRKASVSVLHSGLVCKVKSHEIQGELANSIRNELGVNGYSWRIVFSDWRSNQ